jgi:hypothetical protein
MECLSYDKGPVFDGWMHAVKSGNASDHVTNARNARHAAETIKPKVNHIVGGQIDAALRASLAYFSSQGRVPEAPDWFLRHEALRALNNLGAALAEAAVASHAAALRRRS